MGGLIGKVNDAQFGNRKQQELDPTASNLLPVEIQGELRAIRATALSGRSHHCAVDSLSLSMLRNITNVFI